MSENKLGMFFDLQREVTTNEEFVGKLQAALQKWYDLMGKGDLALETEAMADILRMCDYNPSVLTSYYFPEFSKGRPMTLWTRPHAISMMSFVPNGSLVVNASRQIGKCCHGDTSVTVKDAFGERDVTMRELFTMCN